MIGNRKLLKRKNEYKNEGKMYVKENTTGKEKKG